MTPDLCSLTGEAQIFLELMSRRAPYSYGDQENGLQKSLKDFHGLWEDDMGGVTDVWLIT